MKHLLYALLILITLGGCGEGANDQKEIAAPELAASPVSGEIGYSEIISNLDDEHQACLDKGEAMMQCSYQYSQKMDSMLNVVYKELLGGYSSEQKAKLRAEEREWINFRDKELKKIYSTVSSTGDKDGFLPQDEKMIAYGEEAKLTRDRVLVLIDGLEKQMKAASNH